MIVAGEVVPDISIIGDINSVLLPVAITLLLYRKLAAPVTEAKVERSNALAAPTTDQLLKGSESIFGNAAFSKLSTNGDEMLGLIGLTVMKLFLVLELPPEEFDTVSVTG